MSTILASLFSTPKFVVTNENSGSPAISGVKVKRVSIRLSSKIPRHMREDGTTIVDTRIIQPTVIMVELFAPTLNDVNAVVQLQNDRQNTYTVAARGLTFAGMMAQSTDTKQSAEMISSAPMRLIFKRLLVQADQTQQVSQQAGDAAGLNLGIQLPSISSVSPSSLVQNLTGEVTNLIGG